MVVGARDGEEDRENATCKNRTASGPQDEGGGVFTLYGGGLSVIKWRTTTTYNQNKIK
jgi:hypothetical protein